MPPEELLQGLLDDTVPVFDDHGEPNQYIGAHQIDPVLFQEVVKELGDVLDRNKLVPPGPTFALCTAVAGIMSDGIIYAQSRGEEVNRQVIYNLADELRRYILASLRMKKEEGPKAPEGN